MSCLERDPLRPETVFAGVDGEGLLRSDDCGSIWRGVGSPGRHIRSLAVSAHEPGTLYAGTKPAGVFVSRDDGASWSELEAFRASRRWFWLSPAEPPGWQPYVLGLSLSPGDPNVIVAGVEAGAVVRSEDGGLSWSGHLSGADRDCHALTFHVTDGDWVYEAGGGGPAVSRDGGRSWRHPTEGLEGRYSMACAADPVRPEVWYLSASPYAVFPRFWLLPTAHYDGHAHAAIYRSSGGAPWERLTGGLPQPLCYMPYSLLTDQTAPGELFAGLSNGEVWHSGDYGDSWQKLSVDLGGFQRQMLIFP